MSETAHFRGLWVVMVAMERYTSENERRRSLSGVVGGSGCQAEVVGGGGYLGEVIPPENERDGSFSGVVGAGGRLTTLLELN